LASAWRTDGSLLRFFFLFDSARKRPRRIDSSVNELPSQDPQLVHTLPPKRHTPSISVELARGSPLTTKCSLRD
jgi:hypothetical protein